MEWSLSDPGGHKEWPNVCVSKVPELEGLVRKGEILKKEQQKTTQIS